MRVDFNQNGFSASMGSEPQTFSNSPNSFLKNSFFKKYACPLLGALAVFFALVLTPFGFLIRAILDLMQPVSSIMPNLYIWSFRTAWGGCALFSIASSVVSLVCYAKSNRSGINIAGLVLSIVALSLCLVSIVLGIALIAI